MASSREITIKYAQLIEYCVTGIRRKLTSDNREYTVEEIVSLTEDFVFELPGIRIVMLNELNTFMYCVIRRVVSKYGILADLLDDPEINEIMINGPRDIFVERRRRLERVEDAFLSEDELEEIIRMLAQDVHREINEANPIVDARLPSGYRVSGVLKTVALNGPILTIRKFSSRAITLEELISNGSVSRECCEELRLLVASGYNVFISGGTSSGKTTFLGALADAINPNERVIIIEDSAELRMDGLVNKVHMECRNANSVGRGEITMDKLIKASLRMRPDRIIVGEVRGKEVVDMIQAMNTGHSGSMSTGHGNSIKGMLNRLETMYLMDSMIPMYSVKNQIANAIDIFVHLRRDGKGRRGVVEVAELAGFDGTDYILNYLYKLDEDGRLVPTGNRLIDTSRLREDNAGA